MWDEGLTHHREAALAVAKALDQAGTEPTDFDFVEPQDNTVYYELAFPEEWGLCKPGEAEHLLAAGAAMPTGRLPVNPSGGFQGPGGLRPHRVRLRRRRPQRQRRQPRLVSRPELRTFDELIDDELSAIPARNPLPTSHPATRLEHVFDGFLEEEAGP